MDTGFGARLKAARLAKGLTQAQFAAECGVHAITANRWERGSEPKVDQVRAIATALGCSVDWLLWGEGAAASQ